MTGKKAVSPGSEVKKVLLIDDEIESLREIIRFFENNNWKVSTAIDEKEAILELERVDPSLVLLDLVLEKESGFEVLTQIKKMHPETRVIILSKYFDYELVKQAMKAGAIGFVQKGESNRLPSAFRSFLRGQPLEKSLQQRQ
ncbi:MAG: response regulator [Candidatus Abyssobacteria bacterium SURF_5]|uniref:Response regulator n=1 Tax=Abyssobacteria bacterium (strain SURF_5) TaxID=2093360 RepID=A0A3A4NZZ8_ABYX5|nr:MAG: response regulator [Candidatus Abyssubacteria bacterium SURF_5]